MIGPCFAMHYLVAFTLAIIWPRFYYKCLLDSAVDCLWCSVSLPHGDVGWAAVCNCGISWSYTY